MLSALLTYNVLVVWIYRWPSRHGEPRTLPPFQFACARWCSTLVRHVYIPLDIVKHS